MPYQVIVRTFYRDPFREHPVGGFGFSVNLSWVRRFYFPQLAGQIARVTGMNEGIALSILDDQGAPITTKPFRSSGSVSSRRTFPVLFADPLVLGLNRPPDLPDRRWTVQVQDANPSLSSGPFSGTWMLLVVALTAGLLTIALTMAAHAARVSANLFEIRSDFIATVTHELKTPLATLRAIGEVISSGRISGLDAVHEYAQLIVQESKRLTRLVDNSLAYARVTDVADVYHFEPLDLRSLLDESLRGFNSQFIAQGFELDISIPNDLSPMSGDRTSLGLAFDNLIDNAMRYSGDRRWLSVKVEQLNHMIAVIISDKGVGIAADELAHVRRKFFRGRAAGSGGSGLGLAIVDRIVSAHSGTMTIKSVVGAGTSVSVHLPTY